MDEPLFFTLCSERKLMTQLRGENLFFSSVFLQIKCFREKEAFYLRHFFENALLDLVFHQGFQRSAGAAPSQTIRKLFAHHFLFPSRLVFLLLVAIAVG